MLVQLFALVCLVAIAYQSPVSIGGAGPSIGGVDLTAEFTKFINKHGKVYKDLAEHAARFENFKKSYQNALQLQQAAKQAGKNTLFYPGKFADRTHAELLQLSGTLKQGNSTATGKPRVPGRKKRQSPPASFDWRDSNIVTSVKSQGSCSSCWAFAAAAVAESAIANNNGGLTDLSPEQLVDCRTDSGNGCAPGCSSCALENIRKNGVATLSNYPYVAGSGQAGSCQAQSNGAVFISSWTDEGADESQLTTALYHNGPLVYGIWTPDSFISNYQGGTWDPSAADCQTAIDTHVGHSVTVVGYGTDETGVPYWTIKNSWGQDWGGNGGYFNMIRNGNSPCSMGNGMLSAKA